MRIVSLTGLPTQCVSELRAIGYCVRLSQYALLFSKCWRFSTPVLKSLNKLFLMIYAYCPFADVLTQFKGTTEFMVLAPRYGTGLLVKWVRGGFSLSLSSKQTVRE